MIDSFADCLHIMTCLMMIAQVKNNDTDVCYTSQHLLTISTYFRHFNIFKVKLSPYITLNKSLSILLPTIISINTRNNKIKNKSTIFITLSLCIALGFLIDQFHIIMYVSPPDIFDSLQPNIFNSLWCASFCIENFSTLLQLCHMKKKGSRGTKIANYIGCLGFYKLVHLIHCFISETSHVIVFISDVSQIVLIIVSMFIHRKNAKIKLKNDQVNIDV